MNTKQTEKRVHITLTLPASTRLKAQSLSNTMGVTMSHLIEGLIEGVQIYSGLTKDSN